VAKPKPTALLFGDTFPLAVRLIGLSGSVNFVRRQAYRVRNAERLLQLDAKPTEFQAPQDLSVDLRIAHEFRRKPMEHDEKVVLCGRLQFLVRREVRDRTVIKLGELRKLMAR